MSSQTLSWYHCT